MVYASMQYHIMCGPEHSDPRHAYIILPYRHLSFHRHIREGSGNHTKASI